MHILFENESDTIHPIYHRFYSCGPHADSHRIGNLICTTNLTNKELKRRQKLIERCYIERSIFNELYIHETLHFPKTGVQDNQQDTGHLFRMDLTEKDFKTCFPDITIKIELDYSENFPNKLTITRKHNENIVVLTYTRTFSFTNYGNKVYDNIIECLKEENGQKYIKICDFTNPGKFSLVS